MKRSAVRHTVAALATTTAGVLPVFLFAGVGTLARRDLGFDERGIGLAVAAFFVTSALASVHSGRLGERLGAKRAQLTGVAFSVASLLGIALLTASWAALTLWLAIGGFANAIIQPAANLALARGVPSHRRGFAFGVKQAAVPTAAAIGGFAVPALGVTLGWRGAFAGGVLLALAAGALVPAEVLPEHREPAVLSVAGTLPRSLVLLGGGISLATAAANSMTAYLVESGVAVGLGAGAAGALLGAGSMMGIVTRVALGWIADKTLRTGHLRVVAAMMAAGAVGYAALSLAEVRPLLLLGAALAFVGGWGFNGLFIFSVVRLHPHAPAAATGVTQVGAFGGSVVGPPLFGAVVVWASFPFAWCTLSVIGAAGAVCILLAERRVKLERAVPQ